VGAWVDVWAGWLCLDLSPHRGGGVLSCPFTPQAPSIKVDIIAVMTSLRRMGFSNKFDLLATRAKQVESKADELLNRYS